MRKLCVLGAGVIAALHAAACNEGSVGPQGRPSGRIDPESLVVWRNSQAFGNTGPVSDSHHVYSLLEHVIYATDKTSGELSWRVPLVYPSDVDTSHLGYGLAVAAGLIVSGDIDVFGMDPSTGNIVWRFAPRLKFPSERAFQRIATDGSAVYVGGVWGNVYAVDAATGTQRWASHVTMLPDSSVRVFSPVVSNNRVYVAFVDDHAPGANALSVAGAAAFDATTGQLLWSRLLPTGQGIPAQSNDILVVGDRTYVAGDNGAVYALNSVTGVAEDSVTAAQLGFVNGISQGDQFFLAGDGDAVIIGTTGLDGRNVLAVDAQHLQQRLWTATTQFGSVVNVVADSTRAYAIFAGGQMVVIDRATGKTVWWVDRPDLNGNGEGFFGRPALDGDRVFVASDKELVAFRRR